MNVFLLCTANTTGTAGHHYSVRDIAESFREAGMNARTIIVTSENTHTSTALGMVEHTILKSGISGFAAGRALSRLISQDRPDAILCYDELSVRIAILATPLRRELVIPVKPGWINSTAWTNGVEKFVLFTQENLAFYKGHPKYRNVSIHYIPNRIKPPLRQENIREEVQLTVPQLDPAALLVMCPVRFDPNKDAIVRGAISLQQSLICEGRHAELLVIGSNQHPDYFSQLLEEANALTGVHLSCDARLTASISTAIFAADIVVAAGRTAGEALLLDKVVYSVSAVGGRPFPITSDNFLEMQYYNFTERFRPKNTVTAPVGVGVPLHQDAKLKELIIKELSTESAAQKYRKVIAGESDMQLSVTKRLMTFVTSFVRVAAIIGSGRLKSLVSGVPDRSWTWAAYLGSDRSKGDREMKWRSAARSPVNERDAA